MMNLNPGDLIAIRGQDTGGVAAMIASIQYANGVQVNTDANWKIATTSQANWMNQGFDDSSWISATTFGDSTIAPWNGSLSGTPIAGTSAQWTFTSASP
jgi:hypothetical protein